MMDVTMKKTTHTPGPLTIKGPSPGIGKGIDDGGDYAIMDEAGKVIGEAIHVVGHGDFRPAQANAQLWAAAPAMLEALKRIDDEVPHSSSCRVFHIHLAECDCFQRDVTEAIAQADGQAVQP